MKPLDVLNYIIFVPKLLNYFVFEYSVVALRILLTLPVSVALASGKRSLFFQIKINKTLLKEFNKQNKT